MALRRFEIKEGQSKTDTVSAAFTFPSLTATVSGIGTTPTLTVTGGTIIKNGTNGTAAATIANTDTVAFLPTATDFAIRVDIDTDFAKTKEEAYLLLLTVAQNIIEGTYPPS